MIRFKQFENLFESRFLNERDTETAFRGINKDVLQKLVKEYKTYPNKKLSFSQNACFKGVGIDSNDERIFFSVRDLYRLWEKSPLWRQKKDDETLYVFGIRFCKEPESFIVNGYLESSKGNRFIAIAWKQPIRTIALLADTVISDCVPDAVRLKRKTPLYRLFSPSSNIVDG